MLCRLPAAGNEVVESQNSLASPNFDPLRVIDWLFPNGFDHHRSFTQFLDGDRFLIASAKRLAGLGSLPSSPAAAASSRSISCDVVVIGAGPSGLTIANLLCSHDINTVIVDDSPTDGGSLWSYGSKLTQDFLLSHPCSSALWLKRSTAIALYGDRVIAIGPACASVIHAKFVVLACGSHDSLPLCPGNDLPGVMSARAVSRLFSLGIAIGDKIAYLGDSHSPIAQNIAKFSAVSFLEPSQLAEINGVNSVSSVLLSIGRSLDVELLAVDLPRAPSFELAAQAGARIEHDPCRGYFPICSSCSSSEQRVVDNVFCVGECSGSSFDLVAFQAQCSRVLGAIRTALPA
jgi:sarcosine oxidase subunit alpha